MGVTAVQGRPPVPAAGEGHGGGYEQAADDSGIREVVTSGVRMMALLPGFVTTGFFDRNQLATPNLPSGAWLSPGRVVATALRDLARGRYVSIPSRRYTCASWALRHLPHPLIRPFTWDFTNPGTLWRAPATTNTAREPITHPDAPDDGAARSAGEPMSAQARRPHRLPIAALERVLGGPREVGSERPS